MSEERGLETATVSDVNEVVEKSARAGRRQRVPQHGSARSRVLRHAERTQLPEQTEAILAAGKVAHVAFVVEGQPFVLPFTYVYDAGRLYLHGARAGRALNHLRSGAPVCAEVTLLDGLVASRDAENHSLNYRTAVVFGRATHITDPDEFRAAFERMTEHYFPGRTAGRDYAPVPDATLLTTTLVAIEIEEMSGKARSGPARGPRDADPEAPGSTFVVPLPALDA